MTIFVNSIQVITRISFIFLMFLIILTHDVWASNDTLSNVQSGEALFQTQCAVCHGSEGAGGVGVPLNLPDFLKTSSDQYLKNTIRHGRPGRVMPSFSSFSEQQIDNIIRYIRSWEPDISAPVYKPEPIVGDIETGRQIFEDSCAKCHRKAGVGGKGTGVTYSRPRDAKIIAPAIGHPQFLASASDQMIKQIVMTGRNSTPMVSAERMGLGEEEVNHVVSYLRSLEKDSPDNKQNKRLAESKEARQSVLMFESSYSLQETIDNIKQAALGYNFRYIREQTLDHGFVDKAKENNEQYLIYFCNFTFLNQALSVDPRIGMFLPFRATILKKNDQVFVMTVNPEYLCALFNNDELKHGCEFMSEKYEAMLEESTL